MSKVHKLLNEMGGGGGGGHGGGGGFAGHGAGGAPHSHGGGSHGHYIVPVGGAWWGYPYGYCPPGYKKGKNGQCVPKKKNESHAAKILEMLDN